MASKPIGIDELMEAAEKTSGLNREEMCSNSKKRRTVAVKEAVIVLGRDTLGATEMPQHRPGIDQTRFIQSEICPMAAGGKVLGPFDHPRPDRIQMDVPDKLAEISIRLAENRFVASLKEVTDLVVFSIVILTIAGLHSLHDSTDGIVLHLDQQTNVVRHQAIGVKIEGKFRLLECHNIGEAEVVSIRAEDSSTVIAARNDVIKRITYFDARFPSHGGRYRMPSKLKVNL